MKKIIKFTCFVLLLLSLTACSEMMGQLTCEHEYEVIEEVKATCTKEGQVVSECLLCGKKDKEKLEKIPHDLKKESVISPTCIAEGYTLMVCLMCGVEEKTNIVSSLPHNYDSKVVVPTCSDEGYTLKECKDCGFVEKSNYVEALGHKYGNWETVLEPSDIVEGIKARKCERCAHEEKSYIASKTYVDLTYIKEPFDSTKVYECNDFNELSFRFNCAVANLSEKLVCNVYEVSDFNALLTDLVSNCTLPYSFGLNASLKGNELTVSFEYVGNPIYKTNGVIYTQITSLNYKPTTSSRSSNFNDFKINQSMYEFKVSTSDALHYALERGALPICEEGSNAELIYNEIKAVLREIIDDSMTDTEKVIAIYEWLVMNVTYDGILLDMLYNNASELNRYNGFYLEGVFLDKLAVCEGISKAVTAMCNIEGIRCVTIEGYSATNPNGAGHSWNKVYLDGNWYILDATSGGTVVGNQYEVLTYKFLLCSEKEYSEFYIGKNYTDLKCNNEIDVYEKHTFEYNLNTYDLVIKSQKELNDLVAYLYSVDSLMATIEFEPKFNYGDSLVDEITKAFKDNYIYTKYTYIGYDDSFMLIRK